MAANLSLGVQRDGARLRLTSPGVGYFTCAVRPGRALASGQAAGVLMTLGQASALIVPEGVAGIVESAHPERVHEPVGFGSVLYELGAFDAARAEQPAGTNHAAASGALVFRAPQAGRFWHRTSPAEPALVAAGRVIESGASIGLIEVMKTFTLVHYVAAAGLPARARVVRVLAGDGDEVGERAALIEVEPA